jgi:hypothetical protein
MINLTFSVLLRPVFGSRLLGVPERAGALAHYQAGSKPLLYGILGVGSDVVSQGNGTGSEEELTAVDKY